jgi:uncharacterized protein with GYD domain
MACYMVQAAYTAEAIAAMVKKPEDRAKAIAPMIEGLRGKLIGLWFSFGEYDIVCISELPDNVTVAALSFAVTQSGRFKAFKTTPLLTAGDAMKAMKKASGVGYKPPGK